MQIKIEQGELEVAVRNYVREMGISRNVGEISFLATRGGGGVITEVQITDSDAAPSLSTVQTESAEGETEELPREDDTEGEAESTSLFGG